MRILSYFSKPLLFVSFVERLQMVLIIRIVRRFVHQISGDISLLFVKRSGRGFACAYE